MEEQRYKVVVADDESNMANMVARCIDRSGLNCQVVGIAENGLQAVEMVREHQADILVTDICMPHLDGLGLIEEAQKVNSEIKAVIISGYEEFSYARTAIRLGVDNYLLKPVLPGELLDSLKKIIMGMENRQTLLTNMKELQKQAGTGISYVRNSFWKKLLTEETEEAALQEQAEKLKLDVHFTWGTVGILRFKKNAEKNIWNFEEQEAMLQLLDETKEKYFGSGIHMFPVKFDEKEYSVVLLGQQNSQDTFRRELAEGISRLNKSLKTYYDMTAVCALGGVRHYLRELRSCREEARQVYRTIHYESPEAVWYRPKEEESAALCARPVEIEKELLLHIRLGNEQDALESLDELISFYEERYAVEPKFANMSVFKLVFSIQRLLEENGISMKLWENEDVTEYFKNQLSYGTLLDIRIFLKNYISKCCGEFLGKKDGSSGRLIEEIIQVTEHHLGEEDLDVSMVAKTLNFSANYIRKIFKQKTGEAFGEYLFRRRMEQARDELENTENKIQDVAFHVGYSNQRYFTSCFKKFYGKTPTECRTEKTQ